MFRKIVAVWVSLVMLFGFIVIVIEIAPKVTAYTPHDPIRINSNTEFTSKAGIEGWAGNGLPGSPYIIEGYDINGSGYGYCIYIGNTTVYFEVRDCYLHEADGVWSFPYYPDSGTILYNVQNSTISNNAVSSNNHTGIHLWESRNNTIVSNTGSNNTFGIRLFYSNDIIISNNTVLNNPYGILFDYSSNNTIIDNNASNNDNGIKITRSQGNIITNNSIFSNNEVGIYLGQTISDTITNNTMIDNGIIIGGPSLESWDTHIIDTTNTVNGKPVHYMKNQTSGTAPLGAGQVILANCTNVVVENQNISSGDIGISLGFSNNNIIVNNNVSNTDYGISLGFSNDNTIVNNTVSNNDCGIIISISTGNTVINNSVSNNFDGIYLYHSDNNNVTINNVSSNMWYGIIILESDSNTIVNNNASNSSNGIRLSSSSWNVISNNNVCSNSNYGIYFIFSNLNKIYHNNISENNIQAHNSALYNNQWNNRYPLGGNYWSDYTGNDSYKGPYQDIPGSDGIGDTPYYFDVDSQDSWPLMQPYKPLENHIILKPGWNLISLPFIQEEQNLTRVLGSIDACYDTVWWYNTTDTNDPWSIHNIDKPFGNDLFELNEKMGFWIHITQPVDTIFLYNGTQPTQNQTITLYAGWNLVGYPSITNKTRTAALNNIDFNNDLNSIWTYNATSDGWEEIGPSNYFEVGRGYWIHAKAKCVWEVPL